jgi:ATP-dependent exoDNAse (exonuclease V) alpha subunit
LIVGPAGAGKTTMLRAVGHDFHVHHRPISGLTPTAKAAIVLEQETGIHSDTVAKILHEAARGPNGEPHIPGRGDTVVIDEAGMLSTPDLYRLVELAAQRDWRLVLIGDPHQLQAVGRGGMFAELCREGHPIELEHVHRFTNPWEARASLHLRTGDIRALDSYELHDRIRPGLFVEHLDTIATAWDDSHRHGETLAITTATKEHVDTINRHIQQHRIDTGEVDTRRWVPIANDTVACVGDVIATRHNHRRLTTVTDTRSDGSLTARRSRDGATVTLPAEYVQEHVQLGYAATEHGTQADTTTRAITLVTGSTSGRGLYVGMTRGREQNLALVVTGDHDPTTARDTLETVLHNDRADTPATTRQRDLERSIHPLIADCQELLARLPAPNPEPEWTTRARSHGIEIDF